VNWVTPPRVDTPTAADSLGAGAAAVRGGWARPWLRACSSALSAMSSPAGGREVAAEAVAEAVGLGDEQPSKARSLAAFSFATNVVLLLSALPGSEAAVPVATGLAVPSKAPETAAGSAPVGAVAKVVLDATVELESAASAAWWNYTSRAAWRQTPGYQWINTMESVLIAANVRTGAVPPAPRSDGTWPAKHKAQVVGAKEGRSALDYAPPRKAQLVLLGDSITAALLDGDGRKALEDAAG
jgi:hypothetical protein